MLELLLVDDSRFFRTCLRVMLDDEPGMYVGGEATTGGEAFAMVARRRFDLVLLDVSLPDVTGFQVLKRLKQNHPALPILMVSGHCEPQFSATALNLGAAGYIAKAEVDEQLVAAIWAVAGKTGAALPPA